MLRELLESEAAATSAEYALILAVVGAAIIFAALGLSNAIANEMNDTASTLEQ